MNCPLFSTGVSTELGKLMDAEPKVFIFLEPQGEPLNGKFSEPCRPVDQRSCRRSPSLAPKISSSKQCGGYRCYSVGAHAGKRQQAASPNGASLSRRVLLFIERLSRLGDEILNIRFCHKNNSPSSNNATVQRSLILSSYPAYPIRFQT